MVLIQKAVSTLEDKIRFSDPWEII